MSEAPVPSRLRRVLHFLAPFVVVAVVVVAVRFLMTPYVVPTGSMEPAITPGDRIIATPLTGQPDRGDVVVFTPSPSARQSCGLNEDVVFVKRVVGMPGDQVEVRDNTLIVNDAPYVISGATQPEYVKRWSTVPEGKYLVLGDNRNASCDSHRWEPDPFVAADDVRGVVIGRFWPPGRLGAIG